MQDGESPAPYRPFEPFGRGGARGGTSGGGSSLESLEGLRVEVLGCSKREWVRRSCSSRSSRNSGGGGAPHLVSLGGLTGSGPSQSPSRSVSDKCGSRVDIGNSARSMSS